MPQSFSARRRIANAAALEEEQVEAEGGFEKKLKDTVAGRAPQRAATGASREPQREAPHGRRRRRKAAQSEDMFFIPVDEIPEGLSYEWKRWTNVGQEDPFYIAGLREQGWEPVPAERHPTWVPPNYKEPYILKHGQILMDRPSELTEEARTEERMLAKRQMREAEERLGMAPRVDGSSTMERLAPKVTKEIGRMVPMQIED